MGPGQPVSRPPTRSIYSVARPQPHESGSLGAAILIGIGAFFIFLEGVVEIAAGQSLSSASLGLIGSDITTIGVAMALLGLFLLLTALLVRAEPHHHVANGLLALVVAVFSVFVGFGGFYLGALLAFIGGVAAIVWSPMIARTGVVHSGP